MTQNKVLSGKVALVTGASRGIGRSIALSLGNLGAEVIVNYSSSDEMADEVVTEIRNCGSKSYKLKFDVSNEESVNLAISQIMKKLIKKTKLLLKILKI